MQHHQLAYFTETDLKNFTFYKFPKALLDEEEYKGMKDSAKILYMVFYDRLMLSQENAFKDENGFLYIYYDYSEAAAKMHWSVDKVGRAAKELEEHGLIIRERAKRGMSYRIYVSKLIVDN